MKERIVSSISELQPGNVIRHVSNSESLIVATNLGNGRAIAVRTVYVTNPNEVYVTNPNEWVVMEQEEPAPKAKVPPPESGALCLWSGAPVSPLDIRHLEAKMVGRDMRPFPCGLFHGHIGLAAAKNLCRSTNPEHERFFHLYGHDCFPMQHNQVFEFAGFRLQVESALNGILVWGRK